MANRALLEGMLGGLCYPASPRALADELGALAGEDGVLALLARLRAPRYASANDVCEELFPVEPSAAAPVTGTSADRIAPPRGGDGYTSRLPADARAPAGRLTRSASGTRSP